MNAQCVCTCLCVYLCENLNSVSCFPPLFPAVSQTQLKAMAPILFLLSLSSLTLSHPLLFFFLPFSQFHAVLCFSLISTDRNWREYRQIKPELEKAGERSADVGGMLMQGAFERAGKANRYHGVTLRRNMI